MDIEIQKEYQRQWYQRKKKGEPTAFGGFGLPKKQKPKPENPQKDEVVNMWKEGYQRKEIALKFSLSMSKVVRWTKDYRRWKKQIGISTVEHSRVRRKIKREYIEKKFGMACFFCHKDRWRNLHAINGKPHNEFVSMGWKTLRKIDSRDYVQLCHKCHSSVHWCMKWLNMHWDEIVKRSAGAQIRTGESL